MATVRIIIKWLFIFLFFLLLIIGYDYLNSKVSEKEKEIEYYKTLRIKDSIAVRQYIREQREKQYQYEDSIRSLKVNLIKQKNAKSRKSTIKAIQLLPTATTEYRDSLWSTEWARKDSFPY